MKRILPFLPILVLVIFSACGTGTQAQTPIDSSIIPSIAPPVVTAVIETLTAAAWTPTPQVLDPKKLIDLLNNVMVGSDPLSETVEAKFYVIDVQYPFDDQLKQFQTVRIHVECEWIFSNNCTPEESFVNLIHAFTSNNKMIGKVQELMPSQIRNIQVVTFNHMEQNGIIDVSWQDIVDYAAGKINGSQLGSHIRRFTP